MAGGQPTVALAPSLVSPIVALVPGLMVQPIVALVPGLVMPIVALVPGYVPWRTSDCGPGAQFRYSPPIYTRYYARFS